MHRILYLLVLIILPFGNRSYSQTVYFNDLYHFVNYDMWSIFKNVVELEDGYLVTGGTGDTMNPYWYRIGIMKLDKDGHMICRNTIGDTISIYYTGWPGSLVRNNSGNIFLAGVKQNFTTTLSYGTCYLLSLSPQCDTLWTKEYRAEKVLPIDSSFNFNSMNICNNGDLIFAGELSIYDSPSKVLLMRTDSLGNEKFRQYFGTTGKNRAYSVVQTLDNGFAIGGYWYVPGSSVYTGDPIVIKTDGLGNKQWEKNLGWVYKDDAASVCLSPEGDIVVGTMIADTSSVNNDWRRIQMTKIDENGSIIWSRKYGKSIFRHSLNKIVCLDNGDIVAAGNIPDNSHDVGWLIKVNADGDSLWYRQHKYFQGEDSNNYFWDLINTSDNGFIACGWVKPYSPDTGDNTGWVIKLDSMGCDTPGCDPGVWVPPLIMAEKQELEIYPNPAASQLNCRLSTGKAKSYILIYNVLGEIVNVVEVPIGQRKVNIDVSKFRNGLYLAVLRGKKKVMGRRKFIVKH